MKSINVKRSIYSKEDKQLLASSVYRKVLGEVLPEKNKVVVRVGVRTVGAFEYSVDDKKTCRINTYHIIESEFNPLIVAVDTLSTYFKKNKEANKILWQTK